MFRIGILGAENSHAAQFTEIFNGGGAYPDMRVTAVGGHDREASRKLCERFGVERLCEGPEDMLGHVDAVMVTARDGKYHAPYAEPFLRAGVPAFVDKPFTRDLAEAAALAKCAKARGVPLCGGSSVKLSAGVQALRACVKARAGRVLGGEMTAPVSLTNDYGGFWFYAAHLAESSLEAFGDHPEWVWANRTGNGITTVTHYADYDVTGHYLGDAYHYGGSVMAADGIWREAIGIEDIHALECGIFARMLRTGEMRDSYEQLVRPVAVLQAVERSLATGRRERVEEIIL